MQPRFSFPRDRRLLNQADYSFVFDAARKLSTSCLTLLYRPNSTQQARLGLVIAKKSVKRSVGRNLIKRQTRETFRLFQHKLPPMDIVVLSKRGINTPDAHLLRKELVYLWQKLIKSAVLP